MSKHTPGPWDYTDGVVWGVQADQYGDPEQFKIAECNEIDAPIIAAAPEMYKALIKCAGVLSGESMTKNALVKALEAIASALAKADGKA